jgi:hypothetical protein
MSFLERERRRIERMAVQSLLYAGLYDGVTGELPMRSGFVLLNGLCPDEDPSTRRFSQLEID